MFNKDYYRVLHLQPTATSSDIRKAYRRLALEYHPDKNKTQQASAQFVIISEAYAILSDPVEREKYDQARYTRQTAHANIATTPTEIRFMSEKLVRGIKKINADRINLDKLVHDVDAILCLYHIQLIEKCKDEKEYHLLVDDILFCLQYMQWRDCMRFISRIKEIDCSSDNTEKRIIQFLSHYKRNYYWHKYKIIIALLVAIVTCYLIYWA